MFKKFFPGLAAGILLGLSLTLLLNRPSCPACPACPDCDPKLQLQPFQLDAKSLEKIKRSHISITYSPSYTGNVTLSECDSSLLKRP
ncbi:MAG: hypothetical protein MRZ79_12480 [Bacteroidia bacterium]|nr:hypothetical protein [Bacteroidia bacterium]